MKKSILIVLIVLFTLSCKKSPTDTAKSSNNSSTTSTVTASDLIGHWILDSAVSYSAGVRQTLDYPNPSAYPANGAYLDLLSTQTAYPGIYYDGSGKSYYVGATSPTTINWDLKTVTNRPFFNPHTSNMPVGYVRTVTSNLLILEPGNNPQQGIVFYLHK